MLGFGRSFAVFCRYGCRIAEGNIEAIDCGGGNGCGFIVMRFELLRLGVFFYRQCPKSPRLENVDLRQKLIIMPIQRSKTPHGCS